MDKNLTFVSLTKDTMDARKNGNVIAIIHSNKVTKKTEVLIIGQIIEFESIEAAKQFILLLNKMFNQ